MPRVKKLIKLSDKFNVELLIAGQLVNDIVVDHKAVIELIKTINLDEVTLDKAPVVVLSALVKSDIIGDNVDYLMCRVLRGRDLSAQHDIVRDKEERS